MIWCWGLWRVHRPDSSPVAFGGLTSFTNAARPLLAAKCFTWDATSFSGCSYLVVQPRYRMFSATEVWVFPQYYSPFNQTKALAQVQRSKIQSLCHLRPPCASILIHQRFRAGVIHFHFTTLGFGSGFWLPLGCFIYLLGGPSRPSHKIQSRRNHPLHKSYTVYK